MIPAFPSDCGTRYPPNQNRTLFKSLKSSFDTFDDDSYGHFWVMSSCVCNAPAVT